MTSLISQAPIEAVPLGRHALLHNTASNAIVLVETPSEPAQLLSNLEAGQDDLPREWKEAGLFDRAAYVPQIAFREEHGEKNKIKQTFAVRSEGIELLLPDDTLVAQLACILDRYLVFGGIRPTRTLHVERFGTVFSVYENGIPLTERHTRDEIRFFLIRQICESILGRHRVAATLHGSAVAIGGRAIVFVGASGKGKTTTALGLLQRGARQIADDHVALDTDGRSAIAFPVAIGLKAGTQHLPEAQGLVASSPCQPGVRAGVHYVVAPETVRPGDKVGIAAIVFPDYGSDRTAVPRRISPEESLIRSIEAGARVGSEIRSVGPLAEVFNNTPSYFMPYANSKDAIASVLDLVQR